MLEGSHLLREAVTVGIELEYVLITPELAETDEGRELAALLPFPAELVEEGALASAADSDSPRGVLAVGHLPRGGLRSLKVAPDAVLLYLDRVQDPGNLGAIARVAEAAGASGLLCREGCAHPNHPRALRGSAGSLLRLPVAFPVEPREITKHGILSRFRSVALDAGADLDLYSPAAPLSPPLLLILGSEGQGISREVEDLAQIRLRIPLEEPVDSLNVATAAAVVLYEIRRRESAG